MVCHRGTRSITNALIIIVITSFIIGSPSFPTPMAKLYHSSVVRLHAIREYNLGCASFYYHVQDYTLSAVLL